MSGSTVVAMPSKPRRPEIITLAPEKAMQLLEHNTMNRPLNDQHVQRIARQIIAGKWRFNGDTIKVSADGAVLDGQHRLWSVIEAKKPIETIIVYGIERDAFATIDTLRKPRSGADVLALAGTSRYRNHIAAALTWLLRWQRHVLVDYKAPKNRIENSDIEEAHVAHPGMVHAVEKAMKLRRLANAPIIAFLYYVIHNQNAALADRMMETLEDPATISVSDPFFRLRVYFTADHHKNKQPLMTIALAFKAANAIHKGRKIEALTWRQQGKNAEDFPTLDI